MSEKPADELKQEARDIRKAFLATETADSIADDDLGLTGELIDYHAQWKPVERADLVFDVVCD
jgi:hypothetical protein